MSATTHLIIIVVCLQLFFFTIDAEFRQAKFKVMKSLSGESLCAVDAPTGVSWLNVDDLLHCGIKCTNEECCVVFNFNSQSGKCEIYCDEPRNYGTRLDCTGYGKYFLVCLCSICC